MNSKYNAFIKFIFGLAIFTLTAFVLTNANNFSWAADEYPTKSIKLLIPWNPGGGTDTTIRIIDKVMPKYLSQRLMLINRPGGHGTVAMTELVNAVPDGYLICITASGPTTSVPHKTKVAYTLDDYIPIIQLTYVPNLLVAYPGAPFNTLKELIEYAKKQERGALKVGISGVGSPSSHLSLIRFGKMAGIEFTAVPYKGGGDAAVAVMGGHAPLGSVDLMASGSKISGGNLKPLAIMAKKRSPAFPDIPTMEELGYNIEGGFFNMIIVPKNTPDHVIQTLHDAFKKAMEDPELLAQAKKVGLQYEYAGPEECKKRIKSDYEMIGEMYTELGLKKN